MRDEELKEFRWRLDTRKERWALTWRGWLLLVLGGTAAATLIVLRIHPFLAVTRPVKSPVMVVEGWIPAAAIRAAAEQFRIGGYSTIYTTGGPTESDYDSTDVSDTYASVAAKKLYSFGIPEGAVQLVPCWVSRRDRTYASGVALREWFKTHGTKVTGFNVVTQGVHARRSRLMFEAAFGDEAAVGIISIGDREYDPDHWWRYSEGVKEVISEGAAYLYAKMLFRVEG